MDKKSSLT